MDKPPQLRTVRKYTIQTRMWARPLFFENLLLNNNKISVFQRHVYQYLPTYLNVPRVYLSHWEPHPPTYPHQILQLNPTSYIRQVQ